MIASRECRLGPAATRPKVFTRGDSVAGVSEFADLSTFVALPRLTGLALSQDGGRLVAVLQEPDRKGARYVNALWETPSPTVSRSG